jgi:peptidoglycan/xylan/chitin deacetylase (PgdA/CDA1 family)
MRALVVSPQAFGRQMALLRLLGYRGLSMRALEPYLLGTQKGKVVGLTFDDGYQNNFTHALPILLQHGFSATCYAVSGAMGGTNAWDAKLGVASKRLMTPDEWKIWHARGMEIGSHTRQHVNLLECPEAEATLEIAQSRQDLEHQLGCDVRHFCYPYGWYTPQHRQMVIDAGYVSATTTARGRVNVGDDMFALKRIKVARATTLPVFAAKILSDYEDTRV